MKRNGFDHRGMDDKNGKVAGGRRALDWDAIRQRVALMGDQLQAAEAETGEEDLAAMAAIWQQRAEALARVPIEENQGQRFELVLVRMGREVYGLEVQYVHDIRPLESITRVPRTPEWVGGVVNVRGRTLTALRLQAYFGLPSGLVGDANSKQLLVLVELPESETRVAGASANGGAATGPRESALIVQEVIAVQAFSTSQLQDASGVIRGVRPEYVRGVATRDDGSLLVVLNLPAILNDRQMVIHEDIV